MEDKNKLEEELEFLKESLDAEVITKEEYDKAKKDVDSKIENLENEKVSKKDTPQEDSTKKEIKDKFSEKESSLKEEKAEEKKQNKKEKPKEDDNGYIEIKPEENKEPEDFFSEKEKDTDEIINGNGKDPIETEKENDGKGSSAWIAILALILVIAIGFSITTFMGGADNYLEEDVPRFEPVCSSDDDCVREGMFGLCTNPGEQEAECEFKEEPEVGLTIITKDCFNCDTVRVESILSRWFKKLTKNHVSADSEEGQKLIKDLEIKQLPAYVFDENLKEAYNYEDYQGMFSLKDDMYVLSSTASAANYYVDHIENLEQLEIYLLRDDPTTIKAEENIKGFVDLFGSDIKIKKYNIDKDDSKAKELGINTFPTFVVNNKVKFSGIHPAETVKKYFCEMNELSKCDIELEKSLV